MNQRYDRIKDGNKVIGSERQYATQDNEHLMGKRKKLALFMNKADETKAEGESERKVRKRPILRGPVQALNKLASSGPGRQHKDKLLTAKTSISNTVGRNANFQESQKTDNKRRNFPGTKRPKILERALEIPGSDSEEHLIDVSELSSSPAKREVTSDKSNEDFERIANEEHNLYGKYIKEINDSRNFVDSDVDAVSNLDLGDILAAMESQKTRIGEITFQQYKNYGYPEPPSSKRTLLRKVEKFLPIIDGILKCKERTSYFFDYARAQFETSHHETMSKAEKWQIDWTKYFGGYYGLKRQLFIGEIIKYKYRHSLSVFSQRNEMASYWAVNGFANFVLANELILRMVMEDFTCDFEKAQSIVRQSVDYGLRYIDSHPFNDDLDAGEFFEDESSGLKAEKMFTPSSDVQSLPRLDATKPTYLHQEKDGTSVLDTFLYDSDELGD